MMTGQAETTRFTSSPWGFRFWDWERYCKFMRSVGIRDICGMFVAPDELALSFSEDMSTERVQEILRVNAHYGVKLVEMAGGGDFTVGSGIEDQVDLTKKHIDLSARLGVSILRLFAGWADEDQITETTYGQVSEALREIGLYAKRYDMVVAMENHGGITRTAERVERILASTGLDSVGLNYDPANFLYYGEDPEQALQRLLPYVVLTHLKSCRYDNGLVEYCRVADGVIDYGPILTQLINAGYDGYWGLEYEDESDVEQGTVDDLHALRSLLLSGKTNRP